ncbi:unnamed protein product [Schistocephalus solidus]|uniref:Reverse transcriptase domain-containing protein n=1 Tax=Schistocephalus solidus TaxID=70667 RepID=A0A183TQ66_SCHSO|nr:unnamed protein product [Schistocephalus solidus]
MRSVHLTFQNLVASLRHDQHSVVLIYFDLSKAFEKVQHRRLLVKLETLGIRSTLVDFIGSYLEGIPWFNHSDRKEELAQIQSCLLDTQFQWVTSEMVRGGKFKEVREFQATIQSLHNTECLQEITTHLPVDDRGGF